MRLEMPQKMDWNARDAELTVSAGLLKKLPVQVFDLPVETLSCHDAAKQVDPAVVGFSLLRKLRLNMCGMKEVPREVFSLRNLEHLELGGLSRDAVYEVPDELGTLTRLRVLNLNFSKLRRLPPSLGCLTNLEELILPGCADLEIPPSLGLLS